MACTSRKLHKHELNYPVHEKELLALVDATDKWQCYLQGAKTMVYTDNTCLRYLQTMPKLSPRQTRWLARLQELDLEIIHIPRKTNVVADILSRMYEESSRSASIENPFPIGPTIIRGNVLQLFAGLAQVVIDDWTDDYKRDPEIFEFYFDPVTGNLKDDHKKNWKFNRIWWDDKIVVPNSRISEIIKAHHDSIVAGHWGIHKTVSLIRRRFYFPKMRHHVAQHIQSCHTCQVVKADNHKPRGLMERVELPIKKAQSLGMD